MGGSLASAAAVALGALSVAYPHAASATTHALDLSRDASSVFTTHAPDDSLGRAVAPAGDVNGDGNPDLVLGAPDSSRNGRESSGSAYVVFGSPGFAPHMPLDPLGERGFRIDGAPPEVKVRKRDAFFGDDQGPLTDTAGSAVAGVGDVNGDGLADVAIAAPDASPHKRIAAGAVYVVFGKRTSEPVDLNDLGAGGYRIAGERKGQESGDPIEAAGDVNGDGRGDLLIGAFTGLSGKAPGRVYVVFGRPTAGDIDLAHLGSAGISIRGPWTAGPSLGALGDIDPDGHADVIVGVSPTTKAGDGHAYVIFGRAAPGRLRLGSLGSAGYAIAARGNMDPIRGVGDLGGNFGGLVGGPGDVNGDGRPDLLVGGGDVTYVLFSNVGRKPVKLVRGRAIAIAGVDIADNAPGRGDANGDGLGDVLVSEPFRDPRCRRDAGATSVVYGRTQPGVVRLRNLGAAGYRIDGIRPPHGGFASAAWGGDLDGDGRSDVLVGADGVGRHGRAYVVSGRSGGVPLPPGGPCVAVEIPSQTLSAVARTRRLRVVVRSRSQGTYFLTAHVKHHHALAEGRVYFKGAGSKHTRLTLTRSGRRAVLGRTRLSVRVTAEAYPFADHTATARAVLER